MANKPPISEDEKRKMLSNATYLLSDIEQFYGSFLQELVIRYQENFQTLGITYNTTHNQYEIIIDPHYFHKVTSDNRVALLQHEIQHFTNKHLFRFPFLKDTTSNEDRFIYNIAGDMAINQYIKNLPNGCNLCRDKIIKKPDEWKAIHKTEEEQEACPGKGINVKDWLCDDGTPFPVLKSMDEYYELIKKEREKQSDKDGQPKPEEGSEEANQMNDGAGPKPGETTKGNVASQLTNAKTIDQHFWDSLDEETKKKMLEEAKKLIKRSIEKTSNTYTRVPDSIKDLLIEIDVIATKLDEKSILKNIIKRTVSCVDRDNTWKKPNKRFGAVSPGTKVGNAPFCNFYGDTSGSISAKELNEFLHIISGFLKVGSRSCWLALWHTKMYYKKKYKLHQEIDKNEIEQGGTDITDVLEDIKKTNPACSFILTDGYYEKVDIKFPPTTEIIFIISKGGSRDHPLKHLGKTILLENIR